MVVAGAHGFSPLELHVAVFAKHAVLANVVVFYVRAVVVGGGLLLVEVLLALSRLVVLFLLALLPEQVLVGSPVGTEAGLLGLEVASTIAQADARLLVGEFVLPSSHGALCLVIVGTYRVGTPVVGTVLLLTKIGIVLDNHDLLLGDK